VKGKRSSFVCPSTPPTSWYTWTYNLKCHVAPGREATAGANDNLRLYGPNVYRSMDGSRWIGTRGSPKELLFLSTLTHPSDLLAHKVQYSWWGRTIFREDIVPPHHEYYVPNSAVGDLKSYVVMCWRYLVWRS